MTKHPIFPGTLVRYNDDYLSSYSQFSSRPRQINCGIIKSVIHTDQNNGQGHQEYYSDNKHLTIPDKWRYLIMWLYAKDLTESISFELNLVSNNFWFYQNEILLF